MAIIRMARFCRRKQPEQNDHRGCAKVLCDELWSATRASLCGGKIRCGSEVKKAIDGELFGLEPEALGAGSGCAEAKTQRLLDVTDRPNAPQSTIYRGIAGRGSDQPRQYSANGDEHAAGRIVRFAYHVNIREQKGYTYSPTSQISRRYHDAYWAEIADVTTAATGPSFKEIFGEIDRLQKTPPEAAELQGIQSYMSGLFVIQNSTRQALIGQLRYVDLQGLGEDYLNVRAESECRYSRGCEADDGKIHQAGTDDDRGGRG